MEKTPEKKEIFGKEMTCLICGHNSFFERKAQLNTRLASFFDFDFANKSGTCIVCEKCGYIHWFLEKKAFE